MVLQRRAVGRGDYTNDGRGLSNIFLQIVYNNVRVPGDPARALTGKAKAKNKNLDSSDSGKSMDNDSKV